jgi:hypothetical protein
LGRRLRFAALEARKLGLGQGKDLRPGGRYWRNEYDFLARLRIDRRNAKPLPYTLNFEQDFALRHSGTVRP